MYVVCALAEIALRLASSAIVRRRLELVVRMYGILDLTCSGFLKEGGLSRQD